MHHRAALQIALSMILPMVLLWAGPAYAEERAAQPSLQLEDCRISAGPGFPGMKAKCGVLPRPLDPQNPDSGTFDLHVAVVPALSLEPELDPLVPIAGGPGQSSIEFYAAYWQAFEEIRRNRDIVLVDQRGTGRSAPLDCDAGEGFVESQLSTEEIVAEAKKCFDSLPYDPRYFTTSVAVTDLDAVRQVLGYLEFNLYGISYGTRVAQHYLRRYPDAVRTVILDGVVPPQIALGPAIALEAQKALEAILARCTESEACQARFPDIGREFRMLKDRLVDEAVVVDIPDPVTGETETFPFSDNELAGALRMLSYHPNTVALMPLLIHEAFGRNYAPIAAQYLMSARSVSEALSLGMHNAVVCTEDAPFFEGENVSREALESTYIGPMQLDALEAICSVWPAGVLDDHFKTPVETDKPVLLLSGDADPITPPRFAELAAVDMTQKKLLTGVDQGHGQLTRTCIPQIMARFVETALTTGLDEECLQRQFAMPFFLNFTGPAP
ncbi:MAG: alpha/beta fold hydrolase [Woeseiaceae bacterium]